MFLSPIIDRELRAALRKRGVVKSRFRVAAIGAGIVALFLLFSLLVSPATWGSGLHEILFYWGLYLAVIPATQISVGLFSEERRNQTLGLLYLTGMGPGELFVGKLMGGVLIASCDLLALAPLMAVPFLSGGISLELFLATIACLPVLLLFVISVGLLSSALCKEDGAALVCMLLLAGCISLAAPIPFNLGRMVSGSIPFSSDWLCLSPAEGPYLLATSFGRGTVSLFWMTMTATLAWTGLCLVLACVVMRRNWRSDVEGVSQTGWRGRLQVWQHGTAQWRTDLRNRLLPLNSFQWLVEQDRQPVLLAYGAMGVICAIWMLGWWIWPRFWPSTSNFFITALILILIVNWFVTFTAARRIGMDRHDGVLELLLTTPLTPEAIVDGQLSALKAQFQPVRITALILCILMMLGGFFSRKWNVKAVIDYLLIWVFILFGCFFSSKVGVLKTMWVSLNSGRPFYSVFRASGNKTGGNWYWFWMFFNVHNAFRHTSSGAFGSFPTGSVIEFVVICLIAFFAGIIYLFNASWQLDGEAFRQKLINQMRLIAQEPPPESHDPRFKKWNINESLPRLAEVSS